MMALAMALVGEAVPKARTGSAMGLLGTMSAIGTALGPSLGGALIAGLGLAGALPRQPAARACSPSLLAHRGLPADGTGRKAEPAGFDRLGTLLLALTLGGLRARHDGRARTASAPRTRSCCSAALLGAGLFVRAEAARGHRLCCRPRCSRDPVLSAGLAMGTLVSTVMMATLVVGPFHLSRGLGLEAAVVGLVMSVGPLVAALAGVPAGRLVDRFGAGR